MTLTRRSLHLLALAALSGAVAPALAQTSKPWPDKPIRFVTPYPPGGSSDVITRFIGDGVKIPPAGDRREQAGAAATWAPSSRRAGARWLHLPGGAHRRPGAGALPDEERQVHLRELRPGGQDRFLLRSGDGPQGRAVSITGMLAYAKANPASSFATNGVGSIVT